MKSYFYALVFFRKLNVVQLYLRIYSHQYLRIYSQNSLKEQKIV
jgi:hypothetical protein